MNIVSTELQDAFVLEPKVFGDERGFFLETWNHSVFAELGLDENFVQDNHSFSQRGVLRGLHCQLQHPQGKLVWVVKGAVLDVLVDLRKNSPTFGRWTSFVLTAESFRRVWVPKGFAHGFHVLSESAHFCYKCTDYYAPQDEQTIIWNDPTLSIDWQIPHGSTPSLSEKDLRGVPFLEAKYFD